MIDVSDFATIKKMVAKIDHFMMMMAKYYSWEEFCFYSDETDAQGRQYSTLLIYGDKVFEQECKLLPKSQTKKYESMPESTRRIQYIIDNYPNLAHAILLKFNLLHSPEEVTSEDLEKMNTFYKTLLNKKKEKVA